MRCSYLYLYRFNHHPQDTPGQVDREKEEGRGFIKKMLFCAVSFRRAHPPCTHLLLISRLLPPVSPTF